MFFCKLRHVSKKRGKKLDNIIMKLLDRGIVTKKNIIVSPKDLDNTRWQIFARTMR